MEKADGVLYKGSYPQGQVVATYRNGHVFRGYNSGLSDLNHIEATYQNGRVYQGTYVGFMGTVLGRYESGKIYRGNSTSYSDLIAVYSRGKITSKIDVWNERVVGCYTGDDDGGAAAAITFLL